MTEELPREELLRKMLNMTTSDNDGQALVAIRKANALLASAGWDWDKLLAGKIKIIESPFKNMPNPARPKVAEGYEAQAPRPYSAQPQPRSTSSPRQPQPQSRPAGVPQGLGLTRKNLYANHCYCCGGYVPNDQGFIIKPKDFNPRNPDKWFVCCADCNKNTRPINVNATPAARNTGQTTVRAPAPDLGKL